MTRLARCVFCALAAMGLALCFGAVSLAKDAPAKMSVNERILEILLKRNVVTPKQYQELKQQVEDEREAEAQKFHPVYRKARGVALERGDGSASIALAGRLQIDAKTFTSQSAESSSFYIRRARLAARAKWYRYYSAFVEVDFGQGNVFLNDGFLDISYRPDFKLRFGQFKQPFSMEELHSDNWIWTVERSLIGRLDPSRDIGAMVYGNVGQGMLYYFLSVYNGNGRGKSDDLEESKDVAARLIVAPLRATGKSWLRDLYLGGAVTYGNQKSTVANWWGGGKLTTATGNAWIQVDPEARQDGYRLRYGAELFWSVGPFAIMAELMQVSFNGMEVDKLDTDGGVLSSTRADLSVWGGYGQVSWLLTGEHAPYKGGKLAAIIPKRNFGFGPHEGWGAWQLVFRYDFAQADDGWRRLGFVDADAYADGATGLTFGVNWYINEMVRCMVNFFSYDFKQDVVIHSETVGGEQGFLARIQLIF